MALEIPTIMSPVGVNNKIINNNSTDISNNVRQKSSNIIKKFPSKLNLEIAANEEMKRRIFYFSLVFLDGFGNIIVIFSKLT